ncbi:MAG: hypothetical protein ACLUFM_07380, partial [Lachnospiraceae bacterium]
FIYGLSLFIDGNLNTRALALFLFGHVFDAPLLGGLSVVRCFWRQFDLRRLRFGTVKGSGGNSGKMHKSNVVFPN